jgi:RHS repeat-associated protein
MKFNTYIFRVFSLLFTFYYLAQLKMYAQVTPSSTRSYVLEQTPREAMTTLTNSTVYTSVQSTLSYVDGLGRPSQTVIVRGSGDGTKDVLGTTAIYDNFGRNFKNFLPIPNSTAGGAFLANPQTLGQAFYGDTHPYTEVNTFDNSPLNRSIQSFGAGQAWRTVGSTKPVNRQYNIPAPNTVIYFQAGLAGIGANVSSLTKQQKATNLAKGISYEFDGITAADNSPDAPNAGTTLRYYGANDLTMTTSTSERGKKIIEYRDLQDRVIRKDVEVSSDTTITVHYVYDIFQRLAYVIPSEAYKLFSNSKLSISETEAEFKELIFSYRYDERGRQIRKHIPGVGWTEICYDRLDRPTMSQDPQEASKTPKQWQMLKYDAFGRVVINGITDSYNSSDRDALQTAFNSITTPYERRTTTGLLYSNLSYPASVATTDAQIMKVNYYDDYGTDWIPTGLSFLTATGGDAPFNQIQMNGMLLGYKERNLETNVLYTSTMYYDDRKRMVNSNSENHVGGKDRTNLNYSFTGEVLKARKVHDKGTTISTITEISEYSYDHLGRKKSYKHSLNGATQNVGVYTYDAIGRMIQKGLKPAGLAQSSKQTGNWNDVGSWLSNNVPTLSDAVTINTGHTVTILNGQSGSAGNLTDKGLLSIQTGGQFNVGKVNTNTLQNVDFSWHIRGGIKGINLDASGNPVLAGGDLFSMKLGYEDDFTYFDGNIRSQTWISSIDNLSRTYTYRYDGASRIKAGVYSGGKPNENYTIENMNYDSNGNILNLWRKGSTGSGTFGYVDKLNYGYTTSSNKLNSVTDVIGGNSNTGDFRDGNTVGNDYDYWVDGSMKKDLNKGISEIQYNYLKLPKRIDFSNGSWVTYQYNASGAKLKKITSGGITTDYVGNKIYENGNLYQIGHDEGRIVNGIYEYNITDHLGNLRVAFKDSVGIAKITQAQDYDVWGLENWTSKYVNTTKDNRFRMNGKELEKETGLMDLGMRMYNPTTGRLLSIDKAASLYSSYSTYGYCLNNPIKFVDIEGNFVIDAETARKYPALAYMINSILPNLANNPEVLEALAYTVGNGSMSNDRKQSTINLIKSYLASGSGPKIKVTHPPTNQVPNGPEVNESDGGHYDGNISSDERNNLYINRISVERLEKSANVYLKSKGEKGGGNFAVEIFNVGHTITHEFAHFLLNAILGDNGEDSRGGTYEAGDSFSGRAFKGNTFHPEGATMEKKGTTQFYNSFRNTSLLRGLIAGEGGLNLYIQQNSATNNSTSEKKEEKSNTTKVGGAHD